MVTNISPSPRETESLGESWAGALANGWVIGLTGDLGAGKTQLVKGIARGLGVKERVHSPTFALIHEYCTGRVPLHHVDLYRLSTPAQILSAGLEEYLVRPRGITVVEWIENWLGPAPDLESFSPDPKLFDGPLRLVRLEVLSENERKIVYEDFGG